MGSAQPRRRNVHVSNLFATSFTLVSQAPTSECCSEECVIVGEHVRLCGCKRALSQRQEDGESWKLGVRSLGQHTPGIHRVVVVRQTVGP
jgi:hypothetical protein